MIYLNAGGAVNRKPSKQILDLFLIHTELHLRKIAREISYKWMHEQHAKQHNQLNSILGNTLHAIGFVPFQIATWHFRIYIYIYICQVPLIIIVDALRTRQFVYAMHLLD